MPVFKQPKPLKFTPDSPVEMHFHDSDETWIMMGGRGMAHMVDRDGKRMDFELEEGDIWMIEAGVDHGCDPITDEVRIFPFHFDTDLFLLRIGQVTHNAGKLVPDVANRLHAGFHNPFLQLAGNQI